MTEHKTALDESHRLVATVDFVPPGEPDEPKRHDRFQEAEQIWNWFWRRQEWIFSGRTVRSQKIRREIVREEIEGGVHLSAIARRFGVKR